MKIDLIPIKKFIVANALQEVTEPIIFEKGSVPSSNGLLSTDIFGVSIKDRKETYAFVRLNGFFIQPIVYKLLKRMNRNFESIVNGTKKFIIDSKGQLIEDEEKGETGLVFLYKNWEKISFDRNNSAIRNERIDLITSYDKNTIFTEYWIIIPAFFRDANLQSSDTGKLSYHEINDKYTRLIRLAAILTNERNFDFTLDTTRAKIQNTLVEIYDLLKDKLDKKNGLIRRSLLGKSVDYGSRLVISANVFNKDKSNDITVDFYHTGIPLAQVCSLFTPFVVSWVKRFFQREIEKMGAKYPVEKKTGEIEYVNLQDPGLYFNEEYIKKQIDRFIFSPNHRFEKIELPPADKNYKGKLYLSFTFKDPETEEVLEKRPATWCDLLYQAAVDIVSDKHVWVTRYPLLDYFGMFTSRITILSTKRTKSLMVDEKVYEHYPLINLSTGDEDISINFIDTLVMSNMYLAGLGGDFDGDQVTVTGLFSQEANLEAEKIMKSKSNLLNVCGDNMRLTSNEAVQTLYMLTRFENKK